MIDKSITVFKSGIHNILDSELIPDDAASDALGWLTTDGRIELMRGRQFIGGEGTSGSNNGEWKTYQTDGTELRYKKIDTKIQYYNPSTDAWEDVITGMEEGDVTFANYQSLAGAFLYVFGKDGLWKICTANPTNYASMYDSAKNFKGYGLIDRGRSLLWGRDEDPTGLYGSYIDGQDSDVYTTVSAEALADVSTGTLAFKSGGSKRTCFGVEITVTTSGQVFTDDFNGNLTGDQGGTGTINYMTGAFTTDDTGAGTVDYQWEDATVKGVLDFSKSATRLAGEGFVLRQDKGGDAIKVVLVHEGSYFSLKENSCYKLTLDAADENPTNEVFRTDIGVETLRSGVATGKGVMFMNTANPSKPRVSIIQRNPLGDNFDSQNIFTQFRFENYTYDDAALFAWDKYLLIACKQIGSDSNDRIIMCNIDENTVSVAPYDVRTFVIYNGLLHGGSSLTTSTYELFTGFDDLEETIQNFWESKDDNHGDSVLKRTKKMRFNGQISATQAVSVYLATDSGSYSKIGTIRGDGSYIDYSNPSVIGASLIGTENIGGEGTTDVYEFLVELKIKSGKYRVRKIKFVADEVGYVSIQMMTDFDIWTYQDKLPSKYRLKQNVSLDGETTDLSTPE